MAKKTKTIVRRVVEPTVRVVKRAGSRVVTRGKPIAPLTGKDMMVMGIGGAVGAAAAAGIPRMFDVDPTITSACVAGAGALGAFTLPDGAAQSASVGVAVGGIAITIANFITKPSKSDKSEKKKTDEKPTNSQPAAPEVAARQAALPPSDVQAAFDAARAAAARAQHEVPNGYAPRYAYGYAA